MRKSPLLPFALTCAALLLGAGPAFADGSPTPGAASGVRASSTPATATSSASTPEPTRSARRSSPTPAPEATRANQQVSAVPQGAPDTGVPLTAGGNDDTVVTSALAAGAVVLGGVGAVVVRRRSKVRG
jgi:hypothetical protein